MKPFDFEEAAQGKAICTRDGRKAEIRAILHSGFRWRVHALVTTKDGTQQIIRYMANGKEFGYHASENDLFMADEKATANP